MSLSHLSPLLVVLLVAKPGCPMIVGGGPSGGSNDTPGAVGLDCAPNPVDFGRVPVGDRSHLTVTCTNNNTQDLPIIAVSNASDKPTDAQLATSMGMHDEFAALPPSPLPAALAPGEDFVIDVQFEPTSAGAKSGAFVISAGAAGSMSETGLIITIAGVAGN
jgi:hypothetical protein